MPVGGQRRPAQRVPCSALRGPLSQFKVQWGGLRLRAACVEERQWRLSANVGHMAIPPALLGCVCVYGVCICVYLCMWTRTPWVYVYVSVCVC